MRSDSGVSGGDSAGGWGLYNGIQEVMGNLERML